MSSYIGTWGNITNDVFVLSVIRSSYSLNFSWQSGPPKLTREPLTIPLWGVGVEAKRVLDSEVLSLLYKGVIEEVIDHSSPGSYSSLFLAPKRDEGMRPIIDLSTLNRYLEPVKFRMETTSSIIAFFQQGEWSTSIDLKDAYFDILIARGSRKYFRLTVNGRVFQFMVLPFRLATVPFVFARAMRAIAAIAHLHRVKVYMYLYDWLIRALVHQEFI